MFYQQLIFTLFASVFLVDGQEVANLPPELASVLSEGATERDDEVMLGSGFIVSSSLPT